MLVAPWSLPIPQHLPPPNTVVSLSAVDLGPERGETHVGHPQKPAGGRLGQAAVGTRAPALPSTTGLQACSLLPEPHPHACVR